MTVLIAAFSVWINGEFALTSSVSESSPTASVSEIRLALPTWTAMARRSTVVNPDSSAFSSYVPGGIALMTYSPDSLVCTTRTTLVAWFVSVTVTPGTGSPLVSETIPLSSPDGVCARAGAMAKTRRSSAIPQEMRYMDASLDLR